MAKSRVNTPTKKFKQMREWWELPDALMQGSTALKTPAWLPKEPAESDRNYELRMKRSHLFNAFKKTVQTNVGKVFSKDISINDDVDPLIKLMLDNVDMEGRDIHQFAKSVFEDGLVRGLSAIFVDYTATEPGETRADELNDRPYFVHLTADQLLDVRSTIIGGRERPTYLRFVENVVSYDDDYTEDWKERVKVFQMRDDGVIEWFSWERNTAQGGFVNRVQQSWSEQTKSDQDNDWAITDGGELFGIPYIPIIPFYTNRHGFFYASPPLNELAETNLTHFRSQSDQENVLHIARVPMLKVRGFNSIDPETGHKQDIVISPNTVIDLGSDPQADASWIEHDGKALQAGREHLQDLENQMAVQGLELTAQRPGGQTATEKAIDTAAANSQLKSMALNLQDAIEQAMMIAALYLQLDPESAGSIGVNTDFTVSYQGDRDMANLFELYRNNLIDAQTLLNEAKRRSVLHPDVETDRDDELISNQRSDGLQNMDVPNEE